MRIRSIERDLLVWVLGTLSLGSVLLALVVYSVTLDEMNEVFDVDLKNVAQAMAGYRGAAPAASRHELQDAAPAITTPDESEIVTLTWSRGGERLYTSDPSAPVPLVRSTGLTREHFGSDEWIVYTVAMPSGWAQAAQRVTARRGMAGESAAKVMPPMIALVLIVAGLLSFGLRRGLRPLDVAARSVAARSADSLEPIAADDMPRELEPMVSSINGLISRLATAFSTQRRFLADAAHELRTPVTALRLQLQLLEGSSDEAERRESLAELRAGIDRSQHLIEQFLQISSAEAESADVRPMERLDLGELARSIVARLSAQAEHRGIDLGADGVSGIEIEGHEHQIGLLLTNLIENALRYTHRGGVVDVSADRDGDKAMLRVADNGPGIPESEFETVFGRFYRGVEAARLASDASGSGLGLAIVRAIAERHHAIVSLHTAAGGHGLEARVLFDATPEQRR